MLAGVVDVDALIQLELATLWVVDDHGRMVRVATPEPRPAPLLAVAVGGDALVWACSTLVPDDVAAQVGAVLDADGSGDRAVRIGWSRPSQRQLLRLLDRATSVGKVERGTSFVVGEAPELADAVDCWLSTDIDAEKLSGLLPEDDRRQLREPWAVAVVDGNVVAVCETARWAPASAEPGVWTYEAYRRRGLASAAVAAWIRLAGDRTVFYSTTHDNLASQGVARRLGLIPLGQWWCVYPDLDRES